MLRYVNVFNKLVHAKSGYAKSNHKSVTQHVKILTKFVKKR
jgi:hypothetical protein